MIGFIIKLNAGFQVNASVSDSVYKEKSLVDLEQRVPYAAPDGTHVCETVPFCHTNSPARDFPSYFPLYHVRETVPYCHPNPCSSRFPLSFSRTALSPLTAFRKPQKLGAPQCARVSKSMSDLVVRFQFKE